MNNKHLILILGLLGSLLRVAMWIVVHPDIAYDNHYEPIVLLSSLGYFPAPNQCFECFQPPVFYVFSALVYEFVSYFTTDEFVWKKCLQGVTLLFGLGSIPLVWKLIKYFRFSSSVSAMLFATFCFLPRHILMSVAHSNDTALYFFVLATVLASLYWKNNPTSLFRLVLVALLGTLAILTKSIAVIIFPFLLLFVLFSFKNQSFRWKASQLIALTSIPLLSFVGHLWWKSTYIGNPFQMNLEILSIDIPQRPGERDIHSFRIGEYLKMPLVRQENTSSLLATLYTQFWYESEPKLSWDWFKDPLFIHNYQMYINFIFMPERPDWSKVPSNYIWYGRLGIITGFPFLVFFIFGIVRFLAASFLQEKIFGLGWALLAMAATNLVGIITLTAKFPMYSFMKSAFLLTSTASFLYFIGMGISIVPAKYSKMLWVSFGCLILYSLTYNSHLFLTHLLK